jgi:hypothetical protein
MKIGHLFLVQFSKIKRESQITFQFFSQIYFFIVIFQLSNQLT